MYRYHIIFIPYIDNDVRNSVVKDIDNMFSFDDYDWRYFNLNGFSYTLICFAIDDFSNDDYLIIKNYCKNFGFAHYPAPRVTSIYDVFSNFTEEV